MIKTLKFLGLILLIFFSFSFAGTKVKVTVEPVANGYYAGWAASAGSDFQCVDEEPNNGETDWVASGVLSRENFKMDTTEINDSISASASVDSIRVLNTFKIVTLDVEAIVWGQIRIGTTNYEVGDFIPSTSYVTYTSKWATNPATSAAWTLAQVKTIQCGVFYEPVEGYDVKLTQVLLEVYADVPAGAGGRTRTAVIRQLMEGNK